MSENVHDITRLRELQALPLERKIMITQARIIEWYSRYNGKVYVSFSGGKDSTVLLDIARKCFPDIPAVFADTGLEYPEIRDFVKTVENVTWIRPEKTFKQVILEYGYPVVSKEVAKRVVEYFRAMKKGNLIKSLAYQEFNGTRTHANGKSSYNKTKWKFLLQAPFLISPYCCEVMKKKPFKKYEKETGRKPILGTMASESKARQTSWVKQGCNAFRSTRPTSQPLSFWNEQDILEYLKLYDIPYSSAYGEIIEIEGSLKTTLCNRTGCMFCMFSCHLEKEPNKFQRMKETHPKQWAYMLKPVSEGGLGLKEVLDYIGVPYE